MLSILKNRIYLNELPLFINKKDKRSIRKWCLKNHLQIYRDSSGEFVNQSEFEVAYNLPLILELKKRHGDEWLKYYRLYERKELHTIVNVKEAEPIKSSYIPKGKLSSIFFDGSPK